MFQLPLSCQCKRYHLLQPNLPCIVKTSQIKVWSTAVTLHTCYQHLFPFSISMHWRMCAKHTQLLPLQDTGLVILPLSLFHCVHLVCCVPLFKYVASPACLQTIWDASMGLQKGAMQQMKSSPVLWLCFPQMLAGYLLALWSSKMFNTDGKHNRKECMNIRKVDRFSWYKSNLSRNAWGRDSFT